jgi:hypothetical protein
MSRWVVTGLSEVLAAHAALLPTGHILYFSGSEYNPDQHNATQIDHTRLYDCSSGAVIRVLSPTTDLFCCGHALLADGRPVVAGGTENYPIKHGYHHNHWPGSRDAWMFDFASNTWQSIAAMNEALLHDQIDGGPGGGRWYPTLITLNDGNVLAMSGHPSHTDRRHTNNSPEIYLAGENRWQRKRALGVEEFPGVPAVVPVQYPRLHLLPSGDVFCVTPLDETNRSLRYNPFSESVTYIGPALTNDDYLDPAIAAGLNPASVLLPFLESNGYAARILLCGSDQPLRIEPESASPAWVATAPRQLAGNPRRYNSTAVLLPTGDVFVSGGVSGADLLDTSAVRVAEIYHPEEDRWEAAEEATVIRNYHSVALLMPDGRVWTAGSNHNHEPSGNGKDTRELRIEIFEPWYIGLPRPSITSIAPLGYAQPFEIVTSSAPSINRVALMRCGSITHAFDSDQRYIEADFIVTGNDRLLATAPRNSRLAPPGSYLVFVLQGGVPSPGLFSQLSEYQFRPAHEYSFAVGPACGVVEVFWVRPDGMVFTNGRDPNFNGGNWNNPIPIAPAPGSADTRSGVAAVCSIPGTVEVFWVRPDGMVFTNARDPNINGGNWNNPMPIAAAPGSADPRSGVAAVCPSPGTVEVFWLRPDGMVFTNARDPNINGGNWNNPMPIAPAGSADPRSGVAAVCPAPGIIEVFWTRPDGMVFTNARDFHFNGGNWNNPIPIAPAPGSADPRSQVGAVCPAPGVVEVFWVRPDGMVFTNSRDRQFNDGKWNNPIPIAPAPGSAVIRDI